MVTTFLLYDALTFLQCRLQADCFLYSSLVPLSKLSFGLIPAFFGKEDVLQVHHAFSFAALYIIKRALQLLLRVEAVDACRRRFG